MSLATIRQRDPMAAWAIARTLGLEGGFVDDPKDPGGATAFGVSLRYALAEVRVHPDQLRWFDMDHDGHLDRKDIAGLSEDDAAEVYFNGWWLPGWYGKLSPQLIAWKAFDIAVNTGPLRSAILLQKALVCAGEAVGIDADVGPQTLAAVKRQEAKDQGVALLGLIRAQQAAFYRGLVTKEPDLKRFLAGWQARAAA